MPTYEARVARATDVIIARLAKYDASPEAQLAFRRELSALLRLVIEPFVSHPFLQEETTASSKPHTPAPTVPRSTPLTH